MAFDPATLTGLTPAAEPHTVSWSFAVDPWLFGGGAVARTSDPVVPVRVPSILGQIRFFWRLLEPVDASLEPAAAFERFKTREAEVFGAASQPAPFRAAVQVTERGEPVQAPRMNDRGGYVAFPARPESRGTAAGDILEGVAFKLRISAAKALDDSLLNAISLWRLLGGVGGRTRRGLGAVQDEFGPASKEALESELAGLLAGKRSDGPALNGSQRRIRQVWATAQAWGSASEAFGALDRWYKEFRQDRRPGRPRPGRSYWDEPEEIRRLTRQREPRHQELANPQGKHAPGFARAILGQPVITRFGDPRDPEPTTLQPARDGIDRMASPLLFRPLRVGKRYLGLVTVLSGPYEPPGGVVLKTRHQSYPVSLTPKPDAVIAELLGSGDLRLFQIV